jgi:hypothetical protein
MSTESYKLEDPRCSWPQVVMKPPYERISSPSNIRLKKKSASIAAKKIPNH